MGDDGGVSVLIHILSIYFKFSHIYSVNIFSLSFISGKPKDNMYFIAAPKPITPAILGVPASNLCGSFHQELFENETRSIMFPPKTKGSMFSKSSFFPNKTPTPVGPKHLWPEKE